jgi:hypothetical protein
METLKVLFRWLAIGYFGQTVPPIQAEALNHQMRLW